MQEKIKYLKNKRAFIAYKPVEEYSKSKKDRTNDYNYINYINVCFCPECHKMTEFYKFFQFDDTKKSKEEIDKFLSNAENDMKKKWNRDVSISHGEIMEAIILNNIKVNKDFFSYLRNALYYRFAELAKISLKYRTKTEVLIQCPKCNYVIPYKDLFFCWRTKNCTYKNSFLHKYIIKETEEQIILSAYIYIAFPNIKAEKIIYKDVNVRFVFSKKDHNIYAFQPYYVEPFKPVYKSGQKILNITYLSSVEKFLTHYHSIVMQNISVIKSLRSIILKYYKMTDKNDNYIFGEPHWNGPNWLSSHAFKNVVYFFRYPYYNFETRKCIMYLFNYSYINKTKRQRRKVLLQDLYLMQNNREYMLEIIKKKKCPNKKRFIKMVADNPLNIYKYKMLHNLGMKDYNVMLDILDKDKHQIYSFLISLFLETIGYQDDARNIKKFLKEIILIKGDIWAKNNIFHSKIKTNIIIDTARLWISIQHEILTVDEELNDVEDYSINLRDYIGPIEQMHYNLGRLLSKMRHSNKKIPYYKKDMLFNQTIGEYEFVLPADTFSLVDCGEKLGICVGGYGDSATKQYCIIVFMMHNKQFVGCLEISPSRVLIQAKSKFNNLLQENRALALKQYCELLELDTSQCFDYKHIRNNNIQMDNVSYNTGYNYASNKWSSEEMDAINQNNILKNKYLIID